MGSNNLSAHSEKQLQRQRNDECEATIGQMAVSVVSGDLLRETTDAILNPADVSLSLRGHVSTMIHHAGGRSIRDECDAFKSTHYLQCMYEY